MNINNSTIHCLAVDLSFNTPRNKLSLSFNVLSDTSLRRASFYEYNGVYWFCLECDKSINSVGFASLRTCAASFCDTTSALGFAFEGEEALRSFVRRWEHSLKQFNLRK